MVRVVFKVETHDFEGEESNVTNFMIKRSTSNVNYSELYEKGENYKNFFGMECHYIPHSIFVLWKMKKESHVKGLL